MKIAIDYDNTYTLCPAIWEQIIKLLTQNGHKVYCVTKRYKHLSADIQKTIKIPSIFAIKSKLEAVQEAGVKIDIWIDDNPKSIYPYRLLNKRSTGYEGLLK